MANEVISKTNSAVKRQTAYKAWISDLTYGKYIKEEKEWEPNYILTKSNFKISRANIMGVLVSEVEEMGGNYSFVIEDGTSKIPIRSFDEKPPKGISIGDAVTVIGRPRQFGSEIYILPEIIKKLKNNKWLEHRKMELNIIYKDRCADSQVLQNQEEHILSEEFSEKEKNMHKNVNNYDINENMNNNMLNDNNEITNNSKIEDINGINNNYHDDSSMSIGKSKTNAPYLNEEQIIRDKKQAKEEQIKDNMAKNPDITDIGENQDMADISENQDIADMGENQDMADISENQDIADMGENQGGNKAKETNNTKEIQPKNPIDLLIDTIRLLDSGNGADTEDAIEKSGINRDKAEMIINNLLMDGELFEIKPGKLKIME